MGLSASEVVLVAILFAIVMAPARLGTLGGWLGAKVGRMRRSRSDARIQVRSRDDG